MMKRRETQVILAAQAAYMTELVEKALNSEEHRNHELEGIFALPNGDVIIVWRVAT